MKLKNILWFSAALPLLFACSVSEPMTVASSDGAAAKEAESGYVPGTMDIYLSEDLCEAVEADLASGPIVTRASSEGLNRLYSELGIISMERVFPDAGEYEPRTRREGLHRWYRVTYDASSRPVTRASADFLSIEGIEIAEPVRKIKPVGFNDPYYRYQWNFYNDGTLTSSHRIGYDINVEPVWENYTVGSDRVIVAVVDGGIEYTHPDLASNYVGGFNFCNQTAVVDPFDHGTHVAGIIGAVNNNETGVCGIAGGDYEAGIAGVGLLSCQIFMTDPTDPNNTLGGNSANAIKYGADNGAVICQNSWGYTYSNEAEAQSGSITSTDKDAIDYFIKYAGCDNSGNQKSDSPMKGGIVIFASGNDGWEYGHPATYEPVVAVGAIGPSGVKAYYSNYGDWVDICAPGGDGTYAYGEIYSTVLDGLYDWMAGTSMACPHVSGVAALVVSYCGGQGFTADYLKEKLLGGANSSAVSSSSQIGPLVDALGAVTYGANIPPEKVTSYTATTSGNSITFTWKVTADEDDGKAYGYMLMAAKSASAFDGIDPKNPPTSVSYTTVEVGSLEVGDEMTAQLLDLEFSTSYYVALFGYDYAGNYSDISDIKSVKTTENNPPVISTDYSGDYSVMPYETLNIPYTISDPDGHSFDVSFTHGSDADSWVKNSATEYVLSIDGTLADAGSYTASISVTDSYGATSSLNVQYTIMDNRAPEVVKQIGDMHFTSMVEPMTFDLTEYIVDPDGESLNWTFSNSNINVAYANVIGSSMTLSILGYGISIVEITGTDAKGLSATMSFTVTVTSGDSSGADLDPTVYPNPVSDVLYVSVPVSTTATIGIYSSTGSKVYEKKHNVTAGASVEIDVSGYALGRYTVKVSYDGKEYTQTIVKI